MHPIITDQLFVITGSAGGLGKAFAVKLLELGGKVCLSDVNTSLGAETLRELSDRFGEERVWFVACDVTKEESVENLLDEAEKKFSCSVFCLVNNAGVMGEREGWRLCMEINLTGVMNGMTTAMRRMGRDGGGGGGVVVNISSILGLFCGTQPKGYPYNTSKSAVVTLSRCLGNKASYDKTGVRVLCLCPSVTKTPILSGCTDKELAEMKEQVGGFMTPDQVAAAFIKLLEEGSSGSVMACWNNVPPYFIPDTGMALFIFYTTCAMMCRWIPGVRVVTWPIMICCALAILASWYLGGQILSLLFGYVSG